MPRHPPNALTSRLRVHTTNDNADRTVANGRGYNLSLVTTNAGSSELTPEPADAVAASIKKPIHNVKERRSKPSQYQQDAELLSSSDETWERADSGGPVHIQALNRVAGEARAVGRLKGAGRAGDRASWLAGSSRSLRIGGAYRDRTDDLMLAKQPLSQLS